MKLRKDIRGYYINVLIMSYLIGHNYKLFTIKLTNATKTPDVVIRGFLIEKSIKATWELLEEIITNPY